MWACAERGRGRSAYSTTALTKLHIRLVVPGIGDASVTVPNKPPPDFISKRLQLAVSLYQNSCGSLAGSPCLKVGIDSCLVARRQALHVFPIRIKLQIILILLWIGFQFFSDEASPSKYRE